MILLDPVYGEIDRVFSIAAPIYDERIGANFINRHIRDMEIRELLRILNGRRRLLEIGCGTSQEASRILALTDASVTCLDVSKGMIDYSLNKMSRLGLSKRYRAHVLPAEKVGEVGDVFDVVYSFNGALNSEPNLGNFFKGLLSVTVPGSALLISFRNRFCLGEWLYFRIKNDPVTYRSKRGEYVDVGVAQNSIRVRYLSAREIRKMLSPDFRITRVKGLGIVFPPYVTSRVRSRLAKLVIIRLERIFSLIPVISRTGDQIMVTAIRNS